MEMPPSQDRETMSQSGSLAHKGFVDLQVNGYMGTDFSSPGLVAEDIHRVTGQLLAAGTLAYCATIITSDISTYERNLRLIAQTATKPGVEGRLIGIHMEGPYLSRVNGARGAHSAANVRRPDREEFDRFQDWAEGRISVLTIAPELEGAIALISHVRRRYPTVVSLGHHLASREVIARAVDAGATLVTHLGNGCPNQLTRHDNVLIHQLANESLSVGLITDGNHISRDFVWLALRSKGPEKVFIVSDSAPIAGYAPGIYETLGHQVRLTASGRIENLHAPHLVGSGCNMAQCMQWLRSLDILTEDELWRVGLENPLKIVGATLPGAPLSDTPAGIF
jgi:N-acetylglucosamine-6-phosphate deacetylase